MDEIYSWLELLNITDERKHGEILGHPRTENSNTHGTFRPSLSLKKALVLADRG